jgi:hypothetical protein
MMIRLLIVKNIKKYRSFCYVLEVSLKYNSIFSFQDSICPYLPEYRGFAVQAPALFRLVNGKGLIGIKNHYFLNFFISRNRRKSRG